MRRGSPRSHSTTPACLSHTGVHPNEQRQWYVDEQGGWKSDPHRRDQQREHRANVDRCGHHANHTKYGNPISRLPKHHPRPPRGVARAFLCHLDQNPAASAARSGVVVIVAVGGKKLYYLNEL